MRTEPFVIYLTADDSRENVRLRTNIPEIYAHGDPASDPFLDYCCNSYEFTKTGGDYLPDHQYLPKSAQAFIKSASAVGFRTGVGLPMRLHGATRFGGFNIGSRMDVPTFERSVIPDVQKLLSFCLLLHRRFEELLVPRSPEVELLSPREKEVALILARGASRKECAAEMGISPNTVAEYSKSAYRKLGVRNRTEAALKLQGADIKPAKPSS